MHQPSNHLTNIPTCDRCVTKNVHHFSLLSVNACYFQVAPKINYQNKRQVAAKYYFPQSPVKNNFNPLLPGMLPRFRLKQQYNFQV